MKVFKFGGASVNSADAVRNMMNIVTEHVLQEHEPLVVVVSAMGKTTNLLERLLDDSSAFWQLEDYHRSIAADLLPGDDDVQCTIDRLLEEVKGALAIPPTDGYNYRYDQVVSHGELLSTSIIAAYINDRGISTQWVDARELIVTDARFREARVDWQATRQAVNACFLRESPPYQVFLTQGFIGGVGSQLSNLDPKFSTTTLGREGSDYTAAILAHCIDAESVTIWKDVPGFLNADPKFFPDTVKIRQIPYNEAIELAYYGASVIHPQTVKPLQNSGIPLYIRSFITPKAEGSIIGDFHTIIPETSLYIFRDNQLLLSVYPRDFSFIAEDNLAYIFRRLNSHGIRVNLMQNSALSFSFCVDNDEKRVSLLKKDLIRKFQVRYNEGLQLVTIRYYTQEVIDRIVAGRPVFLEQRNRSTVQLVVQA